MSSRRVNGASRLGPLPSGSLVVIGNFDGVHHGHRKVLASAVGEATERGLAPLVLTFDPHPAVVLRGVTPSVLTSMDRRIELLVRAEPELRVVVEPFTLELSRLGAREFAKELLAGALSARAVVVGENFRFGHGREGDVARLVELGSELGFSARAHALIGDAGGAWSSSRVRDALARADLEEVERVMGRPHALAGVVVHGDGRGRAVGFPTANLGDVSEVLPPHGVYAVLVDRLDDEGHASVLGRGVANFGVRPTLGAGLSIEAHVFDWSGDLYGSRLRVHIVARLRGEERFASLGALVEQIGRDVDRARQMLASAVPDPTAGGAWY